MTEILYNNTNVFSGLGIPTPLLSRSETMVPVGERWAQLETIKLQGQFTGCYTFPEIAAKQQSLLSGFKDNFKTLTIRETGANIFNAQFVKVSDIVFGQSNYAFLLPFEITFECYPSGYFSGSFGVLNPKDNFSFSEDDEGIINITHTIGAQGFVTNGNTSDALANAKSWVQSHTGWSAQVTPRFISGFNSTLCLRTVGENLDRLNATYEITETYQSDIYGSGQIGILRYSTDFSSGIEDGISTIRVQGDIRGCKNQSLTSLRDRYNGFNAYNTALNIFNRITNRTDLNQNPTTKSVSEDSTHKLIGFSYVYTDDLRPNLGVIYSFNFDYNYEEDIVTCNVSATVYFRGAYTTTRWQQVKDFANTINLFPIAQSAYNEYIVIVAPHLAAFPLINKMVTFSRRESEHSLELSLSASFNNKEAPPNGLDSLDYTLNFTPPIRQYSAGPILDGSGQYYIFDLGFFRRGSMGINLNSVGSGQLAIDVSKTQVLALQNQYLLGTEKVLEAQSITSGNANLSKNISINALYSAKQTEFFIT
jgi:hypothetical protein